MTSLAFGFVVIVRSARPTYSTHIFLSLPVLSPNNRFTALDNTIIHPLFGNHRGVFFSVSDRWSHPYMSLVNARQYVRAGLISSLAITKQIVIEVVQGKVHCSA